MRPPHRKRIKRFVLYTPHSMFPRCDPTKNINVSWANPHFVLPSGKHTKNYGTSPFYSWVNRVKPLFRLGHFSIAFCMFTRPGKPPFSHGFPMVFPSYKPPFSIYEWPGIWVLEIPRHPSTFYPL